MNRFSSVLSGYIAACAVGGLLGTLTVALAPGYEVFWARVEAAPLRMALSLLVSTLYVGFFLLLSVWPAVLALGTVAILLRIRNWLYYALGGAVAGVVGAWLITLNPDTLLVEASFSPDTALMNALIGTVMGSVYWYIARYRKARMSWYEEREKSGQQENQAEEKAGTIFPNDGQGQDDEVVNTATMSDQMKPPKERQVKTAAKTNKPHSGANHGGPKKSKSQQSRSQSGKSKSSPSQSNGKAAKNKADKARQTPRSNPEMAPPKSFEDALAEKRGTVKVD